MIWSMSEEIRIIAAPVSANSRITLRISTFAPTSSPRGFVHDIDERLALQPAADHHFLLVAAAERLDRLLQAGNYDIQAVHIGLSLLGFSFCVN
jgi:hypothetical protein